MRRKSDTLTLLGRGALLIGAFLLMTASRAEARGALIEDQGACLVKVGPDILYFSGYQASTGKLKFCEDAPKVGEDTTFVFDVADEDLRQRKIGFRILRNLGDDREPVDGPLVAEVAPQLHPTGTFSLVHRFAEAGHFVGIVTLERASGDLSTARFPFTVGGAASAIPYFLLGLAAALAIGVLAKQRLDRKG
ncbi:MAG TPA: hypothetical protein VMJ31_04495 [Methylocystis sp.]|nr:hypothetical protein [Methylocystis sp.]